MDGFLDQDSLKLAERPGSPKERARCCLGYGKPKDWEQSAVLHRWKAYCSKRDDHGIQAKGTVL